MHLSVVSMPVVHLDLTFHQDATTAIWKDTITNCRPLLRTSVAKLALELNHVGRFDDFVLIALQRHLVIVRLTL